LLHGPLWCGEAAGCQIIQTHHMLTSLSWLLSTVSCLQDWSSWVPPDVALLVPASSAVTWSWKLLRRRLTAVGSTPGTAQLSSSQVALQVRAARQRTIAGRLLAPQCTHMLAGHKHACTAVHQQQHACTAVSQQQCCRAGALLCCRDPHGVAQQLVADSVKHNTW
jgi:hypothetical protein